MERKFKVGERYQVGSISVLEDGNIIKITDVNKDNVTYETIKGHGPVASDFNADSPFARHLTKVKCKDESIVIYRKDNKVIALDKLTGKKGIARCCPEDTFNFETGAKLAFERLMAPQVKEVKRHAKVGEYIKIVNACGCSVDEYKNGDILKVVAFGGHSYEDGKAYYKNERFKYAAFNEYVVLEGYKPEEPTYKVGDRVRIKSWKQMEKEYGLDAAGGIKCKRAFVKSMRKYCGSTLTISKIASADTMDMQGSMYSFSTDMIECKVEDEPEKPTYYNGKIIFTKGDDTLKTGHVYEIKDGILENPGIGGLPSRSRAPFKDIDDVKDYFTARKKRKKHPGWSAETLELIEVLDD